MYLKIAVPELCPLFFLVFGHDFNFLISYVAKFFNNYMYMDKIQLKLGIEVSDLSFQSYAP